MPGSPRKPETKERFFRLTLEEGFGAEEAADRVGISARTAYRWMTGEHRTHGRVTRNAQLEGSKRVPDPREFDKLPDESKKALGDFGYFAERYFAWRNTPWQQIAARISVEAIMDRSERHYGLANTPPGVGKSTLWTLVLPAWLLCGGGFEDPAWGRALRFQFGHASSTVAIHYIERFARVLASHRPYYDKEQRLFAEGCLARDFGRFKPEQAFGDIVRLWQNKQFTVAQLVTVDLGDKEPTAQSVSLGTEYVGDRCEYASWDDLVTHKTSSTAELVEKSARALEREAEQRIEPGGIFWLVGQRINSMDLFRNRLDATYLDEEGEVRPKYFHIKFPAHYEAGCNGSHRQWNAVEGAGSDGCLLDEVRLPWRDILKQSLSPDFRTVFQQEDTNPALAVVTEAMLKGGTVHITNPLTSQVDTVEYVGNYDDDRGWGEFPARANHDMVGYACVDPAAGGKHPGSNWAIEWWECGGIDLPRYLIWGMRQLMQAGDLLDFDPETGEFTGWMHKLQVASIGAGHPIRVWVVEQNSAFKHLFQYRFFALWKERFPFVEVMPHETQKNKRDPVMGVDALIGHKYRNGLGRLPYKRGDLALLNYVTSKSKELVTWPTGQTNDTVMCDWFGEANLPEILRIGRKPLREFEIELQLPEYLMRQRKEIEVVRAR